MSQPVRLGLVFPRSGQQLFIHVPLNVTESAETRRNELLRSVMMPSPPADSSHGASENPTHTV